MIDLANTHKLDKNCELDGFERISEMESVTEHSTTMWTNNGLKEILDTSFLA